MKHLVVVVVIAFCGYKVWERYNAPELMPLYDQPYVVVYGRESCGFTKQAIQALEQADMDYEFFSVDDRAVADELHSRMKISGLDASYYLLPVIDLNNSLSVRPKNAELVEQAKQLSL